jgi:hypothetical protein
MGTPPQPPPPQPGYGAPQQQGNPGIAVAGFVCALVGLLVSWVGWTIVLCVIGLVLSIMGRRQAVERGAPTGLATAGIVLGIIGTVIAIIIIVFVIILVSEGDDVLDDLTITTSTFGQAVIALKMFRGRVIPPLKRLRS